MKEGVVNLQTDSHSEKPGLLLSTASLVVLAVGVIVGLFMRWQDFVQLFVVAPAFVLGLGLSVPPLILYERPHKLCWVGIGVSVILFIVMIRTFPDLLAGFGD